MRLVLLRHAEAEPYGDGDAARVLTARGRSAATAAGRWLARRAVPDLAVVSPAARARETWTLAAARLPAPPPSEVDRRIYANSLPDLLAVLAETDPAVGTLLLVGHNPSINELAHTLDDTADLGGYPTAGLAVFDLPAWHAPAGRLTAFVVPH